MPDRPVPETPEWRAERDATTYVWYTAKECGCQCLVVVDEDISQSMRNDIAREVKEGRMPQHILLAEWRRIPLRCAPHQAEADARSGQTAITW